MRGLVLTGLFLLIFFTGNGSVPDSSDRVIVGKILLEGNKITRPRIILRELKFESGDTIPRTEVPGILVMSRQNVFNTGLFNVVELDTQRVFSPENRLDITIRVIERWYVWPIPFLEFPNRNINAWLETLDFSKLTWGLNIKLFNVRGRNETLTMMVYLGFNQRYGFTYQTPYLNKKQTWGFGFGAALGLNKSLIVGTTENRSDYLNAATGGFLQSQVSGFTECYFRPSLYSYHTLSLSYQYYDFADTLLHIPGYLTDTADYYSFFTLYYKYKLDHRDVRYYPLKGYYFDVELTKQGLSAQPVNLFSIQSSFRKYGVINERWYWATGITVKCSWPAQQPFFLQQNLGYGRNFIRGFEYYTINGNWFTLWKNNLKVALIKPRIGKLLFLGNPKFSVIPYGLFLNIFADAGFVNNSLFSETKDNPLANKILGGFGISIDFITYYDVVIDLNFALNSLGEPGVYIHFTAPI